MLTRREYGDDWVPSCCHAQISIFALRGISLGALLLSCAGGVDLQLGMQKHMVMSSLPIGEVHHIFVESFSNDPACLRRNQNSAQESQPALRITARVRNMARQVQVILFNVASALLVLVKLELPLADIPPMPPPLGLCSRTNSIRRTPEATQTQERTEVIMASV